MTAQADAHVPELHQIKSHSTYTAGYEIECSCGWLSTGPIRQGQALREYRDHLDDNGIRPKEKTA